jgi:predicted Zn-dependent protease
MHLGDIEAEWLEKSYQVMQNDEFAAHLDTVGNRILSQFPPNQTKVRFILIDIPEANSFSVGAGRIYITRKMVGLLHSDDELAGLLGHEMDHILTHRNAVEVTQMFHDVLGVNAVSDQADILDKYKRMLDALARRKNLLRETALRRQWQKDLDESEADRVALNATAAAGFSPRAYVELFDRATQTHGKKGNPLSDFFGTTTPDEKRLREIYKSLNQLPQACREIAPSPPTDEFLTWQAGVSAHPGLPRR